MAAGDYVSSRLDKPPPPPPKKPHEKDGHKKDEAGHEHGFCASFEQVVWVRIIN